LTKFLDGKFEHIQQSENQSALRDEASKVTRRNAFLGMLTLVAALSMSAKSRMCVFAAAINPKTGWEFYKIMICEVPPEHWQDFLEICRIVSPRKSFTQKGSVSVFQIRPLLVMK
jgi:hypothetical protein